MKTVQDIIDILQEKVEVHPMLSVNDILNMWACEIVDKCMERAELTVDSAHNIMIDRNSIETVKELL